MPKPICHIVDDDPAVADSTAFLLRTEGFATTVHATGEAFLRELPGLEAGCILLDIRMPGINGLELQRQLRDMGIDMPVVVITGHGDVDSAVRAMKDGAVDFLKKPFSREELLAAVNSAERQPWRPAAPACEVTDACNRIESLTRREQQVLLGLVKGHANKVIAYDLNLSPRTVELYRANAMRKLGVRSLSEMLQIAFLAGLSQEGETRLSMTA
ncbi:MAG: two-component system response regulator [Pseudomonadota bacterium]|jgi:two-component system response regulator FixJ